MDRVKLKIKLAVSLKITSLLALLFHNCYAEVIDVRCPSTLIKHSARLIPGIPKVTYTLTTLGIYNTEKNELITEWDFYEMGTTINIAACCFISPANVTTCKNMFLSTDISSNGIANIPSNMESTSTLPVLQCIKGESIVIIVYRPKDLKYTYKANLKKTEENDDEVTKSPASPKEPSSKAAPIEETKELPALKDTSSCSCCCVQ